eukprot:snap_masked-scaffold_5-processed-gene-9.21-mRNA-1 protein AED:1.00 eAED:1.00 QI:0/0/0/0/1/1/4/0/86
MDYAASAINKDKTIPKTYFQIKTKPMAEKWYTAYEKELNKLITIGEMNANKRRSSNSDHGTLYEEKRQYYEPGHFFTHRQQGWIKI